MIDAWHQIFTESGTFDDFREFRGHHIRDGHGRRSVGGAILAPSGATGRVDRVVALD